MNKYRPIQKYLIACMKFSLIQLLLMALFAAWSYAIDARVRPYWTRKYHFPRRIRRSGKYSRNRKEGADSLYIQFSAD